MRHRLGEPEAGGRPSFWVLLLLLLAFAGVSLVHDSERNAIGNAVWRRAENHGEMTERAPPREPVRPSQGEFRKAGEP